METILTKDMINALDAVPMAHGQKLSRLRVDAAGKSFRLTRAWQNGFALDVLKAPELSGLVDLYDGKAHLGLCLVTDGRQVGDEMVFDFKKVSPIAQEAAQAFERSAARPNVLITDALSDFQ